MNTLLARLARRQPPSGKRRALLGLLGPFALVAMSKPFAALAQAAPVVTVYKSASCGCCSDWVKHLRQNGFSVNAQDVPDPAVYRKKHGIPDNLGSCHTGVVGGYALEGHVPAPEIKRLLAERPRARGLAVPNMPMGSPGMEGHRTDPYDVILVGHSGPHRVYRSYPGQR